MSYSQIVKAEKIAMEIEWLEYQREYEKEKVQRDFVNLMNRLEGYKNVNKFEKVMTTLKSGESVKKSWAGMVEEAEENGWVSGWPESTRAKRKVKHVSWADAVKC